jgi:nicotinamidase-related amidase
VPSALVVVDVQQGLFAGKAPPYRGDELLQTIAGLLKRVRAAGCLADNLHAS